MKLELFEAAERLLASDAFIAAKTTPSKSQIPMEPVSDPDFLAALLMCHPREEIAPEFTKRRLERDDKNLWHCVIEFVAHTGPYLDNGTGEVRFPVATNAVSTLEARRWLGSADTPYQVDRRNYRALTPYGLTRVRKMIFDIE